MLLRDRTLLEAAVTIGGEATVVVFEPPAWRRRRTKLSTNTFQALQDSKNNRGRPEEATSLRCGSTLFFLSLLPLDKTRHMRQMRIFVQHIGKNARRVIRGDAFVGVRLERFLLECICRGLFQISVRLPTRNQCCVIGEDRDAFHYSILSQ